jgi:DNA-binding IclR family transcriptional regulator
MKERPEWMSNTDVLLLVALDSSELLPVQSPSILGYNLGMSREHASRRLAALSDHGYVEKIEDGKYSVSERGEAFLTGVPRPNE